MKFDASFSLESAFWPAFLVEETGSVKHANAAAILAFGPALERSSCLLSAVWAPDNETTAEKFLGRPERAAGAAQTLKFRLKNGLSRAFAVHVCPVNRDGQKGFCFQLLPAPEGGAGPAPAQPLPALAPAASSSAAVDSRSAQKQKLDCALQLARTVSLDFNNALTSILGHTSLLLAKAAPDNPWRNSLVEIEKSAARAAEIANDLAAFSRQEKDAKVHQSGNLNLLLQRTVDFFRTRETKEIGWTLQLEKNLLSVKFDEAKMQQAFLKLLENSVQALDSDRRVTVSSRNLEITEGAADQEFKLAPGNYVLIEVSDSGQGIPPEVMPRIFEPFFTTKDPARHRGLGLAWVYGVVTNHGGAVSISSRPGAGTTARICLPAGKKVVEKDPLPDSALHGRETILMVDDEDLLLTMGQLVLSSYGYHVLTALSGAKALEIFGQAKQRIDLLVTDLVMPNMSGRELVEKVRILSPSTRILCTSGYVRSKSEEESESYLRKPFTSQDLLRKVRQNLQQ
jgi:two-component system cell cycle sensor histidine kinase/response regulator CckA